MDKLDSERRSRNMAAIRSKDMRPELAVRRLLHRMGFRFRLHRKDLPGTPDIVLISKRIAIFVHGCFWHQHKTKGCLDGRKPKSNTAYWNAKLERNIRRDRDNLEALRILGWRVLVVWECETRDLNSLQEKLIRFIALQAY
jgi:DNA mismatch endonuclease (patch repair protein)